VRGSRKRRSPDPRLVPSIHSLFPLPAHACTLSYILEERVRAQRDRALHELDELRLAEHAIAVGVKGEQGLADGFAGRRVLDAGQAPVDLVVQLQDGDLDFHVLNDPVLVVVNLVEDGGRQEAEDGGGDALEWNGIESGFE